MYSLKRQPLEININPPEAGASAGRDGNSDAVEFGERTGHSGEIASTAPAEPNLPPLAYNPHPEKSIVMHRGGSVIKPLRIWRNILRWVFEHNPWRERTPEEQRYDEDAARRKKMEKTWHNDAVDIKNQLVQRLVDANLCYRYKRSERDYMITGMQKPSFDLIEYNANAIYLRFGRLPRGLRVNDFSDETLLTTLSAFIGRHIRATYSTNGLWYIVEKGEGVRGIPGHVRYQDALEGMPATADELTFPLGMTVNDRMVYRSVKSMPHLLVAGNTDTGKSNMVNCLICTLIARNTPDQLRLVLIDLKGGMELAFYENIPHAITNIPRGDDGPDEDGFEHSMIAPNGIIDNRNDVPDVLDWVIRTGKRRMETIRKAGYKNINGYNSRARKEKMPRIVVLIDELAEVMLSPIGRESADKISIVASQMRAVGIHLIIATQTPKKEVINTLIKSNLPAKMAFSVPTNVASELILDNGNAKGLAPQGRYIYQRGEELEIQAPYMPDSLVREIVDTVRAGKLVTFVKTLHDVTEEDVLKYGLYQCEGDLSIRQLYEQFRNRGISKAEMISMLKSFENRDFEIDENIYHVNKSINNQPRRLIFVAKKSSAPAPVEQIANDTNRQ